MPLILNPLLAHVPPPCRQPAQKPREQQASTLQVDAMSWVIYLENSILTLA